MALVVGTFVIGLAVAIATYLQWWTNHTRLKLDLFEKRLAIFKTLTGVMLTTFRNGAPDPEEISKLPRLYPEARFLFGHDIEEFFRKIFKLHVDMEYFRSSYKDLASGERRTELVHKESEALKQLAEEFDNLVVKFSPYLAIQDSPISAISRRPCSKN